MPPVHHAVPRAREQPVGARSATHPRTRGVASLLVAALLWGCAGQTATSSPTADGATPTSGVTGSPGALPTSKATPTSLPTTPMPTQAPTPRPTPTPMPTAAFPTGEPGPFDPRVEKALAALTTDQELAGQLLMLGWHGTTPASVVATITSLRPGGIVYIGANANTAAEASAINASIQAAATSAGLVVPFISIDQEGGRIQRIDDVPNLGSNMTFGDTDPTDKQACQRGAEQAGVLAGMGFNMNLAPVVDVLTNPANTVIGDRSYGSDPQLVARLGAAYTQGLQGSGIAGVAKHFPGHGSTTVDSHQGLPVVPYGLARLERVELVPFERVIEPDVSIASVMVGHLAMTGIDPSGTPASLSQVVVQGLLRDRLGYEGMVMTDDLGMMGAITSNYSPDQAALMAISAGVDLLLITGDVATETVYRDAIVAGLQSGALSRDQVIQAVQHVLEAKARFGLLGGATEPSVTC